MLVTLALVLAVARVACGAPPQAPRPPQAPLARPDSTPKMEVPKRVSVPDGRRVRYCTCCGEGTICTCTYSVNCGCLLPELTRKVKKVSAKLCECSPSCTCGCQQRVGYQCGEVRSTVRNEGCAVPVTTQQRVFPSAPPPPASNTIWIGGGRTYFAPAPTYSRVSRASGC